MVKAARPGAGRRAEQTAAAKQIMTIRIGDADPVTLALNLVSMNERMAVRKATGIPYDNFVAEDQIGTDSIMVLWWLGRRANGEPTLSYTDAAAEFPTDLDADKFDVTIDQPDEVAGDPEPNGPDS